MNKRSSQSLNSQSSQTKKPKLKNTSITASLHIKCFGSKNPVQFIDLEPRKPYTIGRDPNQCDYIFEHPQVSKTHCQLYFDDYTKKVFIIDGVRVRFRVSLNGVFVDGVRVGNGESKELHAGSEVSVVCGSCFRVGFVVEEIVFSDSRLAYAGLLSRKCREILSSDDPVLYIRKCFSNVAKCGSKNSVKSNNEINCMSDVVPVSRDTLFRDNCVDLDSSNELFRCNVNDRVPLRECSADTIGLIALNTLKYPIPQVDRRNLNKTHEQQNQKPSSSSQKSAIPQVSVPIINGNSRFETHCTWCRKEFLYQPIDPGIMTEARELMCQKCKQKICGVFERSL